jgi:hypothetical protein
MNENTQFIIVIILGLSLVSGWILTWINTADMSHDPKIQSYYENNLYASVAIAVAVLLNLLINVSKLDPMYMSIPGLITLFGYYKLWTNTAKMKSDPNATKYYEKNKKASLLIGIPYGISVLALVYMWISIIKEEPTDYKNATELIKKLKLEYPELNSK